MDIVLQSLPAMLKGAFVSVFVTLVSVSFGSMLGLFAGLSRLTNKRGLRLFATAYVDFFRGTPLLIQLLLIYLGLPILLDDVQTYLMINFGMPQLMDNFTLPTLVAGILVCSLNSGAYIAEIFRAGVQSIEKGQMEAARSLGMTHVQAMRYIILPQALKRVIPPMGNEVITLLKETSLLSVIGVVELTKSGMLVVARTYEAFAIYITIAFFYLTMTFVLSRGVDYLERRLNTGD